MNAPVTNDRFEDRMNLRFQLFEDHLDASLDRFEKNIIKALDDQAIVSVIAIVGTSLSVGLVLVAAWL
jgi:hypothetical protein